jgi:hypothetical protein
MTTVDDLREKLIDLGLTPDEAEAIKGKSNLISKIEELTVGHETSDMFEEATVEEDVAGFGSVAFEGDEVGVKLSDVKPIKVDVDRPEMSDPAWSAYVLSHLEENEKIKGHPKADSLRRLAELLLGPIVEVDTQVPQCPSIENGGRATVIVKIYISNTHDDHTYCASGAADVFPGNTEQLFAKFPVATAETRAEGRAYRKLLRLINVVTAEELVDENEIFDPSDRIDAAQLALIKQMCSPSKLDVNVEKLLEQHDIKVENIDRVSRSKAQEICKEISSFQELGVPDELIGYKPDWR